jgi:CDP-glycerol glycerophosphotransferase (TagB/SpsB family)
MRKKYKIGYYIRTDIQHIPPVMTIYRYLGGVIMTKNKKIYDFILSNYSNINPEVFLVKNSIEARKIAWKRDIKLMVYTGFQMIYWGYGIQIFHGVSDKKYVEDKRILLYDKLLLPGQKHWDKIKNAGYLKYPHRFQIIGYPKFDKVVNSNVPYTKLFNNDKPTILYAPTWITENSDTKFKFSEYGESSLPLWGKKLIKAIGLNWNLMIKYHSRVNENNTHIYEEMENYIKELKVEENVKTIWDDDICIYMLQADLMISDISAVCYEWFHLNRPIVFANPAPQYYKPSKDKFSNNYAWQAGDVIYKEEDIVSIIQNNLKKDIHKDIRNKLLQYSFYKPDGKATERQVKAIQDYYKEIENKSRFRMILWNLYKFLRSL